jgi:hypothetical protein
MVLGGDDIPAILADLKALGATVDVVFGSLSTTGLRDSEATEIFGGDTPPVVAGEESVHVQTGVLTAITSGSSITVDAVSWIVREAMPYGDGAMTRLVLRKP